MTERSRTQSRKLGFVAALPAEPKGPRRAKLAAGAVVKLHKVAAGLVASTVRSTAPSSRQASTKAGTHRLMALKASSMPWLAKAVDLTPPDGGPETYGPAEYKKPTTRG